MATHDYVIANGTGAAVRSDLNGALAAIVSQNSNASAPATTYAYMSWADTSAGVMKMRNGANSAWISLYELDGTFLASDISLAAGSAAAPSLFFTGDTNTGLFSPGADTVALATAGQNRLHVTSGGLVGIGTNSPGFKLHVSGTTGTIKGDSAGATFSNPSVNLVDSTHGVELLLTPISGLGAIGTFTNHPLAFYANNGEKARIDSSGRLLVGTSSERTNVYYTTVATTPKVQFETTVNSYSNGLSLINYSASGFSPVLTLGLSASNMQGTNTAIAASHELGAINFTGNDCTNFRTGASIVATNDQASAWAVGDCPTRLVFSTTADGASSPTERMRINNQGSVSFIKTTASSFASAGVTIYGAGTTSPGSVDITRDGGQPLAVNRLTNDGTLVEFYQDTTLEGSISVSGTTVSYNGAHLSRWSQLPNGATREEILRGTVLSNIDEMCGWDEEDNEQLNRMKVSDVEGDKNVSGVFQAWDDDDDTYVDDFYCAMTGDFIIRIAEGVTVERGDLLMSAGDGTAKPQDDDIIRSKTIAKVTSTYVTCTYEDGSYCVPCVLMAC